MAKPVSLVEGYCPRCLQYHAEPTACVHDMTKSCTRCGRMFGGLCPDMTGRICWRCHDSDGVARLVVGADYGLANCERRLTTSIESVKPVSTTAQIRKGRRELALPPGP